MKKALVVLMAMMLLAAAAWAQADALLGPHNVNTTYGCQSCHAPHNAVGTKGQYLWALNMSTKTYSTYGGGSFDATTAGSSNTLIHTVLCLSCHDSSVTQTMITNPITSSSISGVANDGLQNDHPVNVVYPSSDIRYWNVTITASGSRYSAAFNDNKTGGLFAYGHPASLFAVDTTTAYVQCASCHNPHFQKDTVVTRLGGTPVAVKTDHFLRGEYTTADTKMAFCRSCHADKSAEWTGGAH